MNGLYQLTEIKNLNLEFKFKFRVQIYNEINISKQNIDVFN